MFSLKYDSPFSINPIAVFSLCVFWVSLTFSPALTSISLGAAAILWILLFSKYRSFPQGITQQKSIFIPLGIYVLLVIASALFSEYPRQSLEGMGKMFTHLAIFFLTFECFRSDSNQQKFKWVFILAAILIMADGFWQFFFRYDFIRHFDFSDSSAGVRVRASFKTYGLLACYLISILPLFLMYSLEFRKKKNKSLWYGLWSCFLLLVLILVYTRSRGAILAFISSLLVVCLLNRKILWILGILVLMKIGLAFLPKHVKFHLDVNRQEQSLVERYYLWDRALHVIRAKPILGTGINTYAVAHAKYDKTQNWRVRNYYAHNGYLQMAAETGLISLAVFLIFIINYLMCALRYLKSAESKKKLPVFGISMGIISFLCFMMIDTVFHNPSAIMLFWFLLGLGVAYLQSDSFGSKAENPNLTLGQS